MLFKLQTCVSVCLTLVPKPDSLLHPQIYSVSQSVNKHFALPTVTGPGEGAVGKTVTVSALRELTGTTETSPKLTPKSQSKTLQAQWGATMGSGGEEWTEPCSPGCWA
jgi:hypothetical protein